MEKQRIKIQNSNIVIATNEKNKWVTNIIKTFAGKFKNLNIVTNNIIFFKNLEKELFEEKGIAITITNNKRKSLLNADILVNLDFSEEQINKYYIKDSCLIISIEEKIKIYKKRFNGKIIDNYNIKLKEYSKIFEDLKAQEFEKFNLKDLAECYIMNEPEETKNIIIL